MLMVPKFTNVTLNKITFCFFTNFFKEYWAKFTHVAEVNVETQLQKIEKLKCKLSSEYTVNDRISARGAYLKTKIFWGALIWQGWLFGAGGGLIRSLTVIIVYPLGNLKHNV